MSNLDNETRYWHARKSIKNIRKNGNSIKRELVIAFKNSKCLENVTEDYKESIQIEITSGPTQGTKAIMILPKTDQGQSGLVKRQIAEGTEEAIRRISAATA